MKIMEELRFGTKNVDPMNSQKQSCFTIFFGGGEWAKGGHLNSGKGKT